MGSDAVIQAIETMDHSVQSLPRNLSDYVDVTAYAQTLHMGTVHVHQDVMNLLRTDVHSSLISLLADVKWSGPASLTSFEHWFSVGPQVVVCKLVCARSNQHEGLFVDRAVN